MINLLFLDGDFWTSFIKGGIFGAVLVLVLGYVSKKKKKKDDKNL